MSGSAAFVAYLTVAVFIGSFVLGVIVFVLGVIVMITVAVRKKDRMFSLSATAPGPGSLVRGTRLLTGFGGAGSHSSCAAGSSD